MLSPSHLLKRSESLSLLEKLSSPLNVWKYFLMITETPRPSSKLEGFTKKLLDLAPALGCEVSVDKVGNVRYRMNASPGYENALGICVQAHLDMVTSANSDISINFETDPINVYLSEMENETWMLAKGTTLGADNGLGVASALALFEDAQAGKFSHGQLEALFTVDEETTMVGAMELDPAPFLQSDILLNVDSEEEYAICIGCAGGAENSYSLDIQRNSVENHQFVSFHLKGLLGGHSGVQIHEGRANAIKLLNRLIRSANNNVDKTVKLVSFSASEAPNVIPREAKATIAIPTEKLETFLQSFQSTFDNAKQLFLPVEHVLNNGERVSCMIVDTNTLDSTDFPPLTIESSIRVIDLVDSMYDGVIRMNYDVPGTVQTSTNFANITLQESSAEIYTFTRSSSMIELQNAQESFEALARIAGASVSKPLNPFPGWEPNIASAAVSEMKAAHELVLKKEPKIYAIHAGLECGLIQAVYPSMQCVSVGPEIRGAHSPDERLLVSSVARYYDLVINFVERISKLQK